MCSFMLRIARCRLAYYFYFLCPRAPSIATPLTLSHPPLPTTPSLSTPTHPTPARVPRCFTHSPNLHTLCGAPTNPLTLHCPQPPHSPLPLPPRSLTLHSNSSHALSPHQNLLTYLPTYLFYLLAYLPINLCTHLLLPTTTTHYCCRSRFTQQ